MAETTNAQTAPEFAQNIDFSSGNIGDGLLSSIFGDSWHNMYDSGPTSAVGPLLVDIFTLYNTAIAMAASAVILFLIMSGTMRAAHEGSFFSRYNSIASVMRGVAGAAGIIPIFGMSLVQMMVLSFAGFGFTTADKIAEMTAAHLSTGRPLTTFPAFHDQNKDKALLALLQLETCKAYKDTHYSQLGADPLPVAWDKNEIVYGKKNFFSINDNSCGSLTIDAHYYQIAKYAIDDVSQELRHIAHAIVNSEEHMPVERLAAAKARFKQLDTELADVARIDIDKEAQDGIANFSQSVAVKGWMTLGTWYYTISEQTARFNQRVTYDFTPDLQDFTSMTDTDLGGVGVYIIRSASFLHSNGVQVAEISGAETMQAITDAVFSILDGGGDPYLRLINLGHYAVQSAVVLVGVKSVAAIVSKLPVGAVAKAAGWVSDSGIIGTAVVLCMLGAGVFLSHVLPFIPLCIWIFGLCSVFISILQSVLAAPIWSAAHILPSDNGGHTKQGWMLLMSMTLRPILITIGFICSYFILSGISWVFLESVKPYIISGSVNTPGFDYINFFIRLTVTFILAGFAVAVIAIRAFGFMFDMSDRILDWVGGQAQMSGDDKAASGKIIGAGMAAVTLGRGVGALKSGAKAVAGGAGKKALPAGSK
jgi:hypothetical protein